MAQLQRVLSFPVLLLITINSIMGTGIYFLIAVGAHHAGPASLVSWVIMSLLAIVISMHFAELTSMFPNSGGVYEFCKQVYGRFTSFVIGWLAFIAGNITIAMLIVGAIQYILPLSVPLIKLGLSLLFLWIFHIVAYRGMKTSAVMLGMFAVLTLGTVAVLIVSSGFASSPANFAGAFSGSTAMVLLTVFFIAETFFGWESATFLAGETKNGAKVVPKALILGTIIIALLALTLTIGSIGVLGSELGGSTTPLSDLALAIFGSKGEVVFTLLVYLAIIGAVACWIVSSPRLILAMAEDKLFIPHLAKIHPKFNTPHLAIVFQGLVVTVLVMLGQGSYQALLTLLVPIVLIMYIAVVLCVPLLRKRKPKLKRPYKAPFGDYSGVVLAVVLASMIVAWLAIEGGAWKTLVFGASLIALGLPVYLLLELYYDHKFVRKVSNSSAYLNLLVERITLPVRMRQELIARLGKMRNRKILEFGCNVGTLTVNLADAVGPRGKVYATDLSEGELAIVRRRVKKAGHKHVTILHDVEHHRRVHPAVPKVDAVVSVGVLGYLQDPVNVFSLMNKLLGKGDQVLFLDYDKFFDVIPNIDWLGNDPYVRQLFKDAGFHVSIERKQGFAWKYIIITGIKERDV